MEYLVQTPPEFPDPHAEPPRQVFAPVPVIYERRAAKVEYRVLACDFQVAGKVEAELNAFGGEGWLLVSMLPQEERVLLVFMRQVRR